ncbi:hypothetical protein [Desulfosporosinus sp. FKB]|uniref:hypothetical protein n=1 Tax=Desulfosporosinus sp. FKB TaxID=1969835 RepID=UPI000B49AE1B|nr:hypothetical protein [Desulfosporosinus sp. FKB]
MPLGKMNILGNQQVQMMPQGTQGYQMPNVSGQFNHSPLLGRGLQRFAPKFGLPGGLLMPPGFSQLPNNYGGGQAGTMPGGMMGGNANWGPGPQAGGQGYAAPGYPPQGFQQNQVLQQPMMPQGQGYQPQGYQPQGYPIQGYPNQMVNQGYGGQMPVQPAWESPKKGGIKAFISNLFSKKK